MIHEIKKENIFNFLKAQSIIEELSSGDNIEINENSKEAHLKKVILTNLNLNSNYWILNTESKTFLEMQGKKVEKVILEQSQDGILNIIMVELKSEKVGNQNKILEKFKNSLSWVYLLLNLLNGKENQKIKVFGILVAQEDKKWNEKSTLKIFSSTSIRYNKRSFYTKESELKIEINRLLEIQEKETL
jgi:hypothetical protein